jgi:hypothetical protein
VASADAATAQNSTAGAGTSDGSIAIEIPILPDVKDDAVGTAAASAGTELVVVPRVTSDIAQIAPAPASTSEDALPKGGRARWRSALQKLRRFQRVRWSLVLPKSAATPSAATVRPSAAQPLTARGALQSPARPLTDRRYRERVVRRIFERYAGISSPITMIPAATGAGSTVATKRTASASVSSARPVSSSSVGLSVGGWLDGPNTALPPTSVSWYLMQMKEGGLNRSAFQQFVRSLS